jgi:uncharacterized protein (DUF1499 family)
MHMRKVVLFTLLGLAALGVAGALFFGCAAARPTNLGVHAGRLAPCPDSPNCVSSQAEPSSAHYIAPLEFEGAADAAWKRACAAALALPGAQLVEARDDYLWVEVTTRLLRFVDDLELVLDAGAHRIDVRSASRIGHSDLGVNRKRVEALRAEFLRRP